MENQLGDLKISGSGSAGGGRYNVVSISGSGKVIGDIICEKFRISGAGKVDGGITAGEFNISGAGKVTKDIKCVIGSISGVGKIEGSVYGGNFSISGSSMIAGNFNGDEFTISGAGKVGGRIKSTKVRILGSSYVGEGVEGEVIDIKGELKTSGMVNGDQINIDIGGRIEIDEIGATKVTILNKNQYVGGILRFFIKLFRSNKHNSLVSKIIEADEIYLENTIVDVVRGGKIVIGEGCKIKKVEYSDTLEVNSENSVIDEAIKL